MSTNNKTQKITEAKEQFLIDLLSDDDFLAYRKNALCNGRHTILSYGCVIAGKTSFTLNRVGGRTETILSNYLKIKEL